MMEKTYIIIVQIKKAVGTQTWEVKAASKEDALVKYRLGEGEIIHEEIEVIDLEKVYLDNVQETKE